jgi:site-specific DNA-methyltransferase (adenine-specific)
LHDSHRATSAKAAAKTKAKTKKTSSTPSPKIARAGIGSVAIVQGDNLRALKATPDASFDLIYIDPPFNTGRTQEREHLEMQLDAKGERRGFGGRRYHTKVIGTQSYEDSFADYMHFLRPRLELAHRLLRPEGSLFVHLDYREVHYAKVALDEIFGRACFQNEIIWAYDYGGRSKKRWSTKHDNILWYTKHPSKYCFHYDAIDRIPYMAPTLVGAEKAARGKTPTDTWWHTIVSPTGKEKTGYPTQKPLGILRRIVEVHSSPGNELLDFFAGSGSFGEAAARAGRNVTLVDKSPRAVTVMKKRLRAFLP